MNENPIPLDKTLESFKKTIEIMQHFQEVLPKIAAAFSGAYWAHCYEDGKIIAEFKTRADFAPVRALHVGKWTKDVGGEGARYQATVNGILIIAKVSEFPPSCKLVEKTRIVPASPEHEEKYFEVSCEKSEPQNSSL